MEKFKLLKGIAAPLPMMNVDTDMIIPKQFLKTIKRSGLGKNLFHELRFDIQGNIKNDFVLNWDPYKEASILIAGDNFGCGSSREHAPWSLLDFGFRCIIGPSFADIFYNNCFKNGILPIKLNYEKVKPLLKEAENKSYTSLDVIKKEVDEAKNTFKKYKWPTIDVTRKSVEETAASIIKIYEIYKKND